MNNIEVQHLRRDTLKFFGESAADKIDFMNSNQLEALKREIHNAKLKFYPSHREIRERKIQERKNQTIDKIMDKVQIKIDKSKLTQDLNELAVSERIDSYDDTFAPEISIIIPYMHTKERLPLLIACLETIKPFMEKDRIEVCVVEIGKERNLFLPELDFEYKFAKYNGVMHRAWALNIGARYLSTGKKIVLMDADIIIPKYFFRLVKTCDYPAVAWNKMFYLTKQNTEKIVYDILHKKTIRFGQFANKYNCEVVKNPGLWRAAGGITVIPRNIFFKIQGVPEHFEGTWGGPDNTLMAKLRAFGHNFRSLDCDVMHLWHSKNTPRKNNIALKAREMIPWTRSQWINDMNFNGDRWGKVK